MSRKHLVIVQDATAGQIINDTEKAMVERGHEVLRYETPDRLRADGDVLATADAMLISSNFPYPREFLAMGQRLRAAVFCASGTETIDLDAATELGIAVGHGPTPETYESLAEATILLILALLYDLRRSEAVLREGGPRPTVAHARMIKGKTLGLVGFGKIARAVAERLQHWGVTVVTYMRRAPESPLPPGVERVSLEDLMRRSDIVSIHTSLNEESRRLIDDRMLGLLRPGTVVVNTARGGIVDEDALCRAVSDGRVAGIGLDVFETEPLPEDSALRQVPGALLTPHKIGHTVECNDSLAQAAIENLDRALRGEPPRYLRNPEVLPLWREKWSVRSAAS